MTAVSVLMLMPETKEQIATFSAQIKEQILDGSFDFRKYLYLKHAMEKTFDNIKNDDEVKAYIDKETSKYGAEGTGYHDMKIELAGRKIWDYSQTGDTQLFELEAQKKELEEKIKERQKYLQNFKITIDPHTGEIKYPEGYREGLFPASYKEKTYVKTTISKT